VKSDSMAPGLGRGGVQNGKSFKERAQKDFGVTKHEERGKGEVTLGVRMQGGEHSSSTPETVWMCPEVCKH
jgi:hypothetical protein